MMSIATSRFTQHILTWQALIGAAAFAVTAILSPLLIALERDVAASVLWVGAGIALLGLVAITAITAFGLRKHAPVVRALAAGRHAIRPEELQSLVALPSSLTVRFFVVSSLIATLFVVPGIRPDKLDAGRAVSLLVLSITLFSAAAIPHYMMTRTAALQVVELCPPEVVTALLDSAELYQLPQRRIVRRLLVAVAAPVALVGVGAVLTAHAHLRTQIEQSRRWTATLLARAALEPSSGALSEAGRSDAIAAAAELGFLAHIEDPADAAEPAFWREADGQIAVAVPLDGGQAVVRFSADIEPSQTTGGAALAALGVLLAVALGAVFGRWLSEDLLLATHGVRLLGTESVMRGSARIARPARFEVVSRLGQAIEGLAERFRIFAAAQERALEARDAAQRMRGLLFASVSHDLKSPLNAIIGFAELVGREELTRAQRESLDLIVRRGRELLALIETILDAARVEAGQLTLMPKATEVRALVTEAVRKARELANDMGGEVALEIPDDLPAVPVDTAYATRAIATVVAHALRTAAADPTSRLVRVRAILSDDPNAGGRVCIDVEYGSRDVPPAELEALFARQVTSRGRGLTLGLSLARSVVELHGGTVEVHGAPDGRPVCHTYLPLVLPGKRPRLSSVPRLA